MVATRSRKQIVPAPPPQEATPIIHGEQTIEHWLNHYWQKLHLPVSELSHLVITQDRQEYMRWTGKRLNVLILGCYCYLPARPSLTHRLHAVRRQNDTLSVHRHLIFIEPTMQPQSIEVTVAHELIHLADRVNGTPRRHRHHGYDSIAADEAAVTGYSLEELRRLLHEESMQRERLRRERRPFRYLYECPNCGKQYPRARRYSHSVSCSSCDKSYNPLFKLLLRA
ncbi:MAG: hypothetical protein M3Z24_16490 [Chloroflexota bacterium]|nr:hypothetical protein [Chloroflexota bacterium]